jgi:predicted metal-binding protein
MNRSAEYHLSFATTCRNKHHSCSACINFIKALGDAIASARPVSPDDFNAEGFARLNGCDLPCLVGWKADFEKAYVFGDVSEQDNLDDLVRLAKSIAGRAQDAPRGPMAVPALMLVLDLDLEQKSVA